MAYYHGKVHLNRFERFELSGDCQKKNVAKPPQLKNPDDFGSGIAAQFGLIKKPVTDKRRRSGEDIVVKKKRKISEDEDDDKSCRPRDKSSLVESSHHGKHKRSLVDTNQHKSAKKSSKFANTTSDDSKKNRHSKNNDSSDLSSDECSNSKRRRSAEDIPVKKKRKVSEDEDDNKMCKSRDKSSPVENPHHRKQKKTQVDASQHKLTKSSPNFTSVIFDNSKKNNVLPKHTKANESRDKCSNSDKSMKKKRMQSADVRGEPDDETSDNDNANFFDAISEHSKRQDLLAKHTKNKEIRDSSSSKPRKNSEDIPEKKKRIHSLNIKSEPDDESTDNDNANFFNAISDHSKRQDLLAKHSKSKESHDQLSNKCRKNPEDTSLKRKRIVPEDEDSDKMSRSRDKNVLPESLQHGKGNNTLLNVSTVNIKSEPDDDISDVERANIFNAISDHSKTQDSLSQHTKSNNSTVQEKRKVQARIINLGKDLHFIGKTKEVHNSKGENLSVWFELVNDRLREKSTKTDQNADLNYFITLHSRFKVMETMEMNDLEVLPEEGPEKESDVEPIRIFTNLSKDHYKQYLDEACVNSIPELIITKLYPKCS